MPFCVLPFCGHWILSDIYPHTKVPQTCFPFQVHNFNGIGAAGLETERTKRYSFIVLVYLIVLASFSSVGSCSFNTLENYKERETKTIGRPPSVLFWYWNLSINLSALQMKYRWTFSLKKFDCKCFNESLSEMFTDSCVLFFRLLRAVELIIWPFPEYVYSRPTPLKQNRRERLASAPDSVWEHRRLYTGYLLTMGGCTQVTY